MEFRKLGGEVERVKELSVIHKFVQLVGLPDYVTPNPSYRSTYGPRPRLEVSILS